MTSKQLFWIACAGILTCLMGVVPWEVSAQAVQTQGVVSQTSGPQVVVQLDSSVVLPDTATGRVYPEPVSDTSAAAEISVQSVTGSLVIAKITTPPQQGSVQTGQRVSFQALRRQASNTAQGTLSIETIPPEATVRLVGTGGAEGRKLGTTPVITKLPAGQQRLRFQKSGHIPLDRVVNVGADSIQSVQVNLRSLQQATVAQRGTVVVRPSPNQATVYVDDEEIGSGHVQAAVDEGEHRVRATASDYQPKTKTVNVKGGERHAVPMDLAPKAGTLRVTSTPEDAAVFVSGEEVGRTPMTTTRPAGQDTVRLDKSGFEPTTQVVSISGGATQNVDAQLRRSLNVTTATHGESAARNVRLNRDEDQLRIRYNLPRADVPYRVHVELSLGGRTYREVPAEFLKGDVGESVSAGGQKEISWRVLEQYSSGLTGNQNRVRVVAEKEPSHTYPGRPGIVLNAALRPTLTGAATGNTGGANGLAGRLGYSGEDVGVFIDGFRVESESISTFAIGPELDVRVGEQGTGWPIGYHVIIGYKYYRSKTTITQFIDGRNASVSTEGTIHQLHQGYRAYYVLSLGEYVELIPNVRWTAFSLNRYSTSGRGEFLNTSGQSSGFSISFSSALRGGVGLFLGGSDFGVLIEASSTLGYSPVALSAGLRF